MLTNPLFLIGLVAVGIPIAIHLLQLRRYRKVYFSNVDMLEELQNESRKQHDLRRLLILVARILAIVFLVLAFCQPVIRNRASKMKAGGTAVSVYVDNSYSMECGGMEGSLIESARQKAREIAEAYKPDDMFQLITNDMDGSQFRWLTREEFLSAVDGIQTCAVTQNLSAVSLRQNDFLSSAQAANRRAYVVSDFQRSTADIVNMQSDSNVLVTFIPLGGTAVANVYIDSLAFNSPAYCEGATVRVEAFVRNDGDKAVERLPLRLFVADKQRALAAVDVAAHATVSAEMTFTIGDEESLQGYVETTDYPITFDDKLFFSLDISRKIPILVIEGQNGTATQPLQRLFQGDSIVQYHQVAEGQIDYNTLMENKFIILDGLRAIPTGMAQTLHDFVSDGGSLLTVPAENADMESYNRMLASMQAPTLGVWQKRKCRATEVHTDHDLYRGVFQHTDHEVELPTVEGYYHLDAGSATVSVGVIALPDGSDFLTHTPCGNGSVYLFNTPLTHSDFAKQALFVPTLYNMALHSTPVPVPYHLLTGTDPIALSGRYDGDQSPHLTNEDGTFDLIPDLRRMGSRHCLMPHGDILQAGNYLLRNDKKQAEGLSFNYSRQESDLAFYSRDEVKKLLRDADIDRCSVMPSSQKSVSDYIRQQGQGRPLWRWFIVLALLAIVAEIVLCRRESKGAE